MVGEQILSQVMLSFHLNKIETKLPGYGEFDILSL